MAKTVQRGIKKPAQKSKGTNIGPVVQRSVSSPSSDFDKRPNDANAPGGVTYVGPSKLSGRSSAPARGATQRKR